MDMKVVTILRGKTPKTVREMKVSELDGVRCSKKFNKLNLGADVNVYVDCEKNGDIIYSGNYNQYTILNIKKFKKLSWFDVKIMELRKRFKI